MAELDGRERTAGGIDRSTDVLAEDEPGSFQSFRLRIVSGPDRGRIVEAASDRLVIGTHASNEVVLRDGTVSRFHCELKASGGRLTVTDAGSSNGTIVDGVAVTGARLHHGALLRLGRTELRVELGTERVRAALSPHEQFGRLVGRSVPMRAAFAVLERAIHSDATVLVVGEPGVGKDLAAEMLHANGPRAGGPLAVVDCGSLPPPLMESELFGHARGALPGDELGGAGAFEAARGGTVLLHEVGDLPSDLQPKLLRALQLHEIYRFGGRQRIPVDVRVVATSSRDLWTEVNARRFRPELFFQLSVVRVSLPPLRERLEDVPLLVDAILSTMGATQHARAATLRSQQFLDELSRHTWPGNVRQLRNHLERCLLLDASLPVDEELFALPPVETGLTLAEARARWLRAFERRYAEGLLRAHDDNVSAAARAAGVDRTTFHRLLSRCGLTADRRGR